MSHFSVIVATKEYPTEEVLRRELQPYHEFECTGTDDQYVQDVDRTAEARESFEQSTATRLRDQDGKLHEPWDDRFYRDPTTEESEVVGKLGGSGVGNLPDGTRVEWSSRDWEDGRGYRSKVKFVPDGWVEANVPQCEVQTLAEYAAGEYGLKVVPNHGLIDLKGDHKYGYVMVDKAGEVLLVMDRTNPKKTLGLLAGGRPVLPQVHP